MRAEDRVAGAETSENFAAIGLFFPVPRLSPGMGSVRDLGDHSGVDGEVLPGHRPIRVN
jgi:hypothetical protein